MTEKEVENIIKKVIISEGNEKKEKIHCINYELDYEDQNLTEHLTKIEP